MNKRLLAHLALVGTNIFFAINFTAVKHLINHGLILPFGLNLIRAGITTILLWGMFLLKPSGNKIKRKDVLRFVLCGLTGIAINQLLFLKGLSLTFSIHASLLMLVTPIIITLVAAWLLKEMLTTSKIIGLLCGISGATMLITSRGNHGFASNVLLGDILVILNAASYAFYFILVKPLMSSYNNVMIIRIIFTVGFFVILPFGWHEFTIIPWNNYSSIDWTVLGMIVFAGTFLAYLLNVYGIKVLGASVAGTYIYSQPFFASVIAIIVLHEKLSVPELFAGILIFAGVFFSTRIKKAGLNNTGIIKE